MDINIRVAFFYLHLCKFYLISASMYVIFKYEEEKVKLPAIEQ